MKMENKWYLVPDFENLYEFNPILKEVRKIEQIKRLKKQGRPKIVSACSLKPQHEGDHVFRLYKNNESFYLRLPELLRNTFPERNVKTYYSFAGTTNALAQSLCQRLDLSIGKLKAKFRVGAGCLEMQAVIYALRNDYKVHETEIAKVIGKERSTILYHYNVFEKQLPIYDEHQRLYQLLKLN